MTLCRGDQPERQLLMSRVCGLCADAGGARRPGLVLSIRFFKSCARTRMGCVHMRVLHVHCPAPVMALSGAAHAGAADLLRTLDVEEDGDGGDTPWKRVRVQ